MASPGPRTTDRYGKECKATAVRLSQLSGVSVTYLQVSGSWRYLAIVTLTPTRTEHESPASDDGQRPHGVLEQVDEIGHVSPSAVQQETAL
jgi:hypothetical protein